MVVGWSEEEKRKERRLKLDSLKGRDTAPVDNKERKHGKRVGENGHKRKKE